MLITPQFILRPSFSDRGPLQPGMKSVEDSKVLYFLHPSTPHPVRPSLQYVVSGTCFEGSQIELTELVDIRLLSLKMSEHGTPVVIIWIR